MARENTSFVTLIISLVQNILTVFADIGIIARIDSMQFLREGG